MGRYELPILPGAAQCRRQQLHAGHARLHRIGGTCGVQCTAERPRPGVKPGVPAENDRRLLAVGLLQQCANFVRFVEGGSVVGAAIGQVLQQAACPDDQPRALQCGQPAHRQASGCPTTHAHQCDPHKISLHRCKIVSALSPCSSGRRSTMSCTPHCAAASAFSAKPPATPPSFVTI